MLMPMFHTDSNSLETLASVLTKDLAHQPSELFHTVMREYELNLFRTFSESIRI